MCISLGTPINNQFANSSQVSLNQSFRIILTTVLVCSKFYNDVYFSNDQVASLGGVHYKEMNHLEIYLLQSLDYTLFIDQSEFDKFFEGLQIHIQEMTRIEETAEQAYLQAVA